MTCATQILEHGDDLAAVGGDRAGPVDLVADHRERRTDVVVQVAGDARSLFVGGQRADAAEHAGVVDGDAERLGEAVDDLGLLLPEAVGLVGLDGDETDERAPGAQRCVQATARRRRDATAEAEVVDADGTRRVHRSPSPSGRRSSWNDDGGVKPSARIGSTARSVALTRKTESAS